MDGAFFRGLGKNIITRRTVAGNLAIGVAQNSSFHWLVQHGRLLDMLTKSSGVFFFYFPINKVKKSAEVPIA
jgi:hypothetical protein